MASEGRTSDAVGLPLKASFDTCSYAPSDKQILGKGWAVGGADKVEVFDGSGTFLGTADLGVPRADVAGNFPEYGEASPGWSFRLPFNREPGSRESVTIVVTSPRKQKKLSRPIERLSSRVVQHFKASHRPMKNDFVPFVGRHRGQRAFVIGNGPSLNDIDMSLLEDEITLGSNRVYLGFKDWGYDFKYWACQDELQIKQGLPYYNRDLPEAMIKFVPNEYQDSFTTKNTYGLNILRRMEDFPKFTTAPNVFFEGWTVTYLLLQIAFLMGCNPIYLVGVDYSYQIDQSEMRGDRWADARSSSHFVKDYMAADEGVVWNVPQFERTDLAFACAAESLRANDVSVLNATPGSRLNVFQKVRYESLFEGSPRIDNRFGKRDRTALIVALSEDGIDIAHAQNACPPEFSQLLFVPEGTEVSPDTAMVRYDCALDALLPRIMEAATDVDRIYLSVSARVEGDPEYRETVARIFDGLPEDRRGLMVGDRRPTATLDEAIAIVPADWVS